MTREAALERALRLARMVVVQSIDRYKELLRVIDSALGKGD